MGGGHRTFTLMVGETRAAISLCSRKRRPGQQPVPPDRTMWPKRIFQRAGLQELTLRKAFMWMPRLFLPVETVGVGGKQRCGDRAPSPKHPRAHSSVAPGRGRLSWGVGGGADTSTVTPGL